MKATVQLDPSNRIILSKDLRRAAGFSSRQKLNADAGPGRIVLEVESNSDGKVVKRGLCRWPMTSNTRDVTNDDFHRYGHPRGSAA